MDRKDQYTPKHNPSSGNPLREEGNTPEPLYDKTDRNFQSEDQGLSKRTTSDADVKGMEDIAGGSSSDEEKDII